MNVHDHITDWQHLPSSFLAGKRAIATTVEGTTIDGFLQSMTTNVSEKDKTLNEIIDWCENQRRKILADIEPAPGEDAEEAYADLESVIRSDNPIIKYSNDLLDGSEAFVYGVIMQARLLDHIIDHCRSMLGYSGNMPSEVPNQSEDAKK